MKTIWIRLNRISFLTQKHTFLAACAFCILLCFLICICLLVNHLCSPKNIQTVELENTSYSVANFKDRAFENAVRVYLGKPKGDLYVEELNVMKELILSGQDQLKDLGDLGLFPNLIKLNISTCSVYDVSPISALKYLNTIILMKNRIKDITPLCSLEKLQILDVSYNNISQIPDDFRNLHQLINANLSSNRIARLDPIASCENLKRLNLSRNRLTHIPNLSTMKSLVEADFSNNAITKIALLADMDKIETLNLSGNLLHDLDFLYSQQHIVTIDLSYNDITNLSILTTCLNLESLTFYGVADFDLSPLEHLPKFNSIYLDENFQRQGNIDFLLGRFKNVDKNTLVYLISKLNKIEGQ